jgi:hypothetical protein
VHGYGPVLWNACKRSIYVVRLNEREDSADYENKREGWMKLAQDRMQ